MAIVILFDRQPEALKLVDADVAELQLDHEEDWTGYVKISWREGGSWERVSIRAAWLLQGVLRYERDGYGCPSYVACRAVALAVHAHARYLIEQAQAGLQLHALAT